VSGGHGHGGGHAGGRHRWRLAVAFVLVGGFFGVELVAGLLSQSLALISDAGHMAADVVTLGAALVATRIATRPDNTGRRTFGSYRAEVFASGLAVLLMIGGLGLHRGGGGQPHRHRRRGRFRHHAGRRQHRTGGQRHLHLLLLRGGARDSLNVKGAYLEVIADTVGLGRRHRRGAAW
jgi:cobalt-zinc-cadmium efflux system protein